MSTNKHSIVQLFVRKNPCDFEKLLSIFNFLYTLPVSSVQSIITICFTKNSPSIRELGLSSLSSAYALGGRERHTFLLVKADGPSQMIAFRHITINVKAPA